MSKILQVRNSTKDFNSYRAARVKSLFNAENGSEFNFDIEVDLSGEWTIGVIVGPSGSGKTSLGSLIFDDCGITDLYEGWEDNKPIVDCIAPKGDFNDVTGALANVGLGDVPAWLRNFNALSNGQKFRAGLARLMVEKPNKAVIDEYTSVVDRQVAVIGSKALQKAWRRGNHGQNKLVLLTPHYDVLDWLQPDWIIDTKDYKFHRGAPRQMPKIELEIIQTDSRYWKYFKPHYYLDLPEPVASNHFVGLVNGELACHVVATPMFQSKLYRLTRLVTMPEWQGAGVGMRFLNWVSEYHLEGKGRTGKPYRSVFHTSHPQLIQVLRRSPLWIQTSAKTFDTGNKVKVGKKGTYGKYGGNLRAIQGFQYVGGENSPKIILEG
ncbi:MULTISPECIES: hypothetical protein [unclassified Enterococcus]|uniref:hypothetical protein n=1 Tax=unclassified Enterococcus TaxID=2608891 RepID=UPI0028FD2E23|nr:MULTISPECIES: hypothetical protein [unclassified Enterococcus]MDU0319168.1 hypothetical protein [Enterococcus sp. 2STP]MDU0335227.1 hypothetical protein [Enterococcus sp. 2CBP]MDU0350634.1 hypothetical protein [Enterococcus sp. 3MOLP]